MKNEPLNYPPKKLQEQIEKLTGQLEQAKTAREEALSKITYLPSKLLTANIGKTLPDFVTTSKLWTMRHYWQLVSHYRKELTRQETEALMKEYKLTPEHIQELRKRVPLSRAKSQRRAALEKKAANLACEAPTEEHNRAICKFENAYHDVVRTTKELMADWDIPQKVLPESLLGNREQWQEQILAGLHKKQVRESVEKKMRASQTTTETITASTPGNIAQDDLTFLLER